MSKRAVILAPHGRDAPVAAAILRDAGIETYIGTALASLPDDLDNGAGFVLITEEALHTADLRGLADWLDRQPEWADLPFILITNQGGGIERNPEAQRYLSVLGNVTFLERPFHPTTLISLARSALRGRQRQYDASLRIIALHESEARYATLFETMNEGFCIVRFVDAADGGQGDYVHVLTNTAYARHSGLHNVVGRSIKELLPEEADDWIRTFANVLETGAPLRFERELIATHRHLELSAFRLEPASRREVAILFQDVTARKRAEIALHELNTTLERRIEQAVAERQAATDRLHEAQKIETIGQLTGGVAHDFNNLLTPIMGTLDLLNRRYAKDDPRMAQLLDGALQSAERARLLVSRLLGFARRQALETKPTDYCVLLTGIEDLIVSSIGPAISLNIECPSDLPAVIVDQNQVELAVLNLCVNARDAMPDGGQLTISVKEVSAAPGLSGNRYLCMTVTDTGIGMSRETLARAVEPFYSTKEIGKGTGLGLSMVHGLAGQLGGAFVLQSELGRGTQAQFYLPVSGAHVQTVDPIVPAATPNVRSLRILLVDDEELVRFGTAEMLRELGHSVWSVSDGAKAMLAFGADPQFDLVITDYMMPDINGAQLAKNIIDTFGEIPILIVTGYAGGDLNIGFPQLLKPFRQADLAKAIGLVCNKPR